MARRHSSAYPRSCSATLCCLVLALGFARTGRAQTCWAYSNTPAPAPIQCVQEGNHAAGCNWDPDCHQDGDASDCCTTVGGPAGQTVLEMHTEWHDCFGAVGDTVDADNPPMRGNRWYAFHRQFEHDYNQWRESGNFCNPTALSPQGCKIESMDWCPDMLLPYGFDCDLAAGGTGCGAQVAVADESAQDCLPGPGTNACRPDNAPCPACGTFPQCLFIGGGGPGACPAVPSASCSGGAVSFPYTQLEDFKTVEEVSTLLDASFHGSMHTAVGSAGPCKDINNAGCSPRDPMFWRLHKAIDDVVRAWQDINATDVMLVIDRSGSMNQLDSTGDSKLQAALEAAELFGDLLEDGRSDGLENHVGVVSYSSSANDPARNLAPVVADNTLLDAGQPFRNVLDTIAGAGGGGCTGIGSGIEAAAAQICPGGDCSSIPDPPPAGTNRRKAMLLLTDGVENVPPCLQSAGPPGATCGGQCFGAQIDFSRLHDTQVCAVGFGDAGSLNGDLLTLFAERQGGIYMQNPATDPDGEWIDLKDFFAKCFGQLTDEFLGLDPRGILAAHLPATEAIEYTSCGDRKLTWVSGWKTPVKRGDLRLLVHAPNGDLVRAGGATVETSLKPTWDFARLELPYQGSSSGLWQGHLVRPHSTYVNGFTTDSFRAPEAGVALVRRQIQRLCPDGCKRVLYFEDKTFGVSVYEKAVAVEQGTGLLGHVETVHDARLLARQLRRDWDLIVYAHQGKEGAEPSDGPLAERLCRGQRAIVTDTRFDAAAGILKCAGAAYDGSRNHQTLEVERTLLAGRHELANSGRPMWSYGLRPAGTVSQAHFDRQSQGIVARAREGVEQRWFVDVLVKGLSKLEAHKPVSRFQTGADLLPAVRISPFTLASGGFDRVTARVEIERPLVGMGTLLGRAGLSKERTIGDEKLDPRAATLLELERRRPGGVIPTATDTFPLFDDGTHGDLVANNHYWSVQLAAAAKVDGMYRYRFLLDLEKNGCTTRRELVQSVFVEVGVDPAASGVRVEPDRNPVPGSRRFDVTLTPRDRLGNLWGPGRPGTIDCRKADGCACSADRVVDHGDGAYTLRVEAKEGSERCAIDAFGSRFEIGWGGEVARCDTLLKALTGSRLERALINKLRQKIVAACDRLEASQGSQRLANAASGSTFAEALHEIESHAGPDMPATEAAELKRLVLELMTSPAVTHGSTAGDGHPHH